MQTDPSTVLKVSAICGASYGAQMGLAADTFEPVYYKSGSGRSASWEWFGHAIRSVPPTSVPSAPSVPHTGPPFPPGRPPLPLSRLN